MPPRFLTQEQVCEELNISKAQTYPLIRRGDLHAMKVGGRGVWRVSRDDLEEFIERGFGETQRWVEEHPFTEGDEGKDEDDGPAPSEGPS